MDKKPRVELSGADGNAFAIIGACKKAAKRAKWAPDRIDALMKEMMSGDYNHLLRVAMQHFDVV